MAARIVIPECVAAHGVSKIPKEPAWLGGLFVLFWKVYLLVHRAIAVINISGV